MPERVNIDEGERLLADTIANGGLAKYRVRFERWSMSNSSAMLAELRELREQLAEVRNDLKRMKDFQRKL